MVEINKARGEKWRLNGHFLVSLAKLSEEEEV